MKVISKKYNDIANSICSLLSKSGVQTACFLLYKIIVDFIYIFYTGRWNSFGVEVNVQDIISGYLAVIILSYFVNRLQMLENASAIILMVIYMIYFVPITTYCGWGTGSSGLLFFMILYAFLISLLEIKLPIYSIKISNRRKSESILSICFYCLFIMVGILILYIAYRYTNFRIIINLNDVYEYRAEVAEYDMPGWMSRLQSFSNILIPLLILLSFVKKKILFVLIGCALLVLNFSYAGHKSILFMGIFLFLGYFFWRKGMMCLFLPAGCIFGIIGILEYQFSSHAYIISYFFRRQGYVLAQLSDYYYRFFSENPTDIFRSTFLGKVGFTSLYSLPIPKVIGNNYSTQTVNCNNGLLADVWAHLGVIGIVIMPLILIICFRLFDMATSGLSTRYIVGLAAYYAVTFSNTTWSTVLLTHGYLIMCVAFFMFPRDNLQKSEVKT